MRIVSIVRINYKRVLQFRRSPFTLLATEAPANYSANTMQVITFGMAAKLLQKGQVEGVYMLIAGWAHDYFKKTHERPDCVCMVVIKKTSQYDLIELCFPEAFPGLPLISALVNPESEWRQTVVGALARRSGVGAEDHVVAVSVQSYVPNGSSSVARDLVAVAVHSDLGTAFGVSALGQSSGPSVSDLVFGQEAQRPPGLWHLDDCVQEAQEVLGPIMRMRG